MNAKDEVLAIAGGKDLLGANLEFKILSDELPNYRGGNATEFLNILDFEYDDRGGHQYLIGSLLFADYTRKRRNEGDIGWA